MQKLIYKNFDCKDGIIQILIAYNINKVSTDIFI